MSLKFKNADDFKKYLENLEKRVQKIEEKLKIKEEGKQSFIDKLFGSDEEEEED